MRILALDDERPALFRLTQAIAEALPEAQVRDFVKARDGLACVREGFLPHVAFLDIEMPGMSGMELARELKSLVPNAKIVFITGFAQYAVEAYSIHADGYIMKPVTAEKLLAEMRHLQSFGPLDAAHNCLRIKCFGNFDAYTPDGVKLHFERSKAKELLAYLVYRCGTSCSVKEIAAALFEDSEYDKKQQGYVQKIISSMMQTLKAAGAEDVIVKQYNSLSVDTALVDCDYYRFAKLDAAAVNAYAGEFMSQYAWAEFAIGYLEEIYRKL